MIEWGDDRQYALGFWRILGIRNTNWIFDFGCVF
jgi:hypothetical protein